MNRKKELAMNTVILAVGKICTQLINFFLLPLYTSLLTTDDYGVVDLFSTYTALLVPIFNWQLENGLFRFLLECREDRKRQKIVFSTVFIANIIQIVITVIFFCVLNYFSKINYQIFLAGDISLTILMNTFFQLARGIGKNSIYAFGNFLMASLTVAFNVIFIAFCGMGAKGMLFAFIVSKGLCILYLSASLKIFKYFEFGFDKNEFKNLCKYSIPLVPNTLSWWIVGASDRTIISKILGIGLNGVYSVANKFSTLYITMYNVFNLSWTESVSLHMEDKDSKEFLGETINIMFKLFTSIMIFIISFIPIVFTKFVNQKFSAAYYQIPILMVASEFQVIVGLYSVIYVAKKKSSEIAKTSFYAAMVNIFIDILLINKIGLFAGSVSTLMAYAVMAIYRYFHVKKYINIPLKKNNVIITTIVCCSTCIMYYINNFYTNILSIIFISLWTLVYNYSFIKTVISNFSAFAKEKILNRG